MLEEETAVEKRFLVCLSENSLATATDCRLFYNFQLDCVCKSV